MRNIVLLAVAFASLFYSSIARSTVAMIGAIVGRESTRAEVRRSVDQGSQLQEELTFRGRHSDYVSVPHLDNRSVGSLDRPINSLDPNIFRPLTDQQYAEMVISGFNNDPNFVHNLRPTLEESRAVAVINLEQAFPQIIEDSRTGQGIDYYAIPGSNVGNAIFASWLNAQTNSFQLVAEAVENSNHVNQSIMNALPGEDIAQQAMRSVGQISQDYWQDHVDAYSGSLNNFLTPDGNGVYRRHALGDRGQQGISISPEQLAKTLSYAQQIGDERTVLGLVDFMKSLPNRLDMAPETVQDFAKQVDQLVHQIAKEGTKLGTVNIEEQSFQYFVPGRDSDK